MYIIVKIYLHFFVHIRCLCSSVTGGHFTAVLIGRSWCTAAASLLVRVLDLIIGISSYVGRLRRVICACSEKGVCRQYEPSPLCTSCIYRLLASMAVLFRESSTLLCGLLCFLLVSKCRSGSAPIPSDEDGYKMAARNRTVVATFVQEKM